VGLIRIFGVRRIKKVMQQQRAEMLLLPAYRPQGRILIHRQMLLQGRVVYVYPPPSSRLLGGKMLTFTIAYRTRWIVPLVEGLRRYST